MSRGVNKVILIGHLGQDPEMRTTPGGDAVASVSLATDESYRDKATGEMVERIEWHRLTFWRSLAEIVGKYCRKGSKLYIEGSLYTEQYERDGQNHYITKIKVRNLVMLDGRGESAQEPPANDQTSAAGQPSAADKAARAKAYRDRKNTAPPPPPAPEDPDDDIPFMRLTHEYVR